MWSSGNIPYLICADADASERWRVTQVTARRRTMLPDHWNPRGVGRSNSCDEFMTDCVNGARELSLGYDRVRIKPNPPQGTAIPDTAAG